MVAQVRLTHRRQEFFKNPPRPLSDSDVNPESNRSKTTSHRLLRITPPPGGGPAAAAGPPHHHIAENDHEYFAQRAHRTACSSTAHLSGDRAAPSWSGRAAPRHPPSDRPPSAQHHRGVAHRPRRHRRPN